MHPKQQKATQKRQAHRGHTCVATRRRHRSVAQLRAHVKETGYHICLEHTASSPSVAARA
jgi:hypothetical protein